MFWVIRLGQNRYLSNPLEQSRPIRFYAEEDALAVIALLSGRLARDAAPECRTEIAT